ncbi:MAG: HEAT repeat domain-containing protein [Myxococcota bacterium]
MVTLFLAGLAMAGSPTSNTLEALSVAPAGEWSTARAEALASVEVSELSGLAKDSNWQIGLTAQALQAWRTDETTATATWSQVPAVRRDGTQVFTGRGVPAVIGERLQHGGETVVTRRALVDWLRRSTASWPSWADSAYAAEEDAGVRAAWVDAARFLKSPGDAGADGRQVVALAFDDADADVRAQAARIASYLEAASLVSKLKAATADSSDEVAGLAARSLGILRVKDAYEEVAQVLDRTDPRARLWTIRALERLDRDRAAQDARIAALQSDADLRVARAATGLTAAKE